MVKKMEHKKYQKGLISKTRKWKTSIVFIRRGKGNLLIVINSVYIEQELKKLLAKSKHWRYSRNIECHVQKSLTSDKTRLTGLFALE